jgi:retron-type reverse transcriptase
LLLAWDRVEENEGGPGVDGVTLDDFELRLDEELQALGRDLRDHVYHPQPLLRALMPKPSGGTRGLAIPTVRDRVAQSAAALVITPILEREFEAASFGFRKRRSVPHAVAQVRRYYDEGYRWVVDADIDNFFDEVERQHLLIETRQVGMDQLGASPGGRDERPRREGIETASEHPRREGIETEHERCLPWTKGFDRAR